MPGGDRTGPNGMGPMTGRGLGYCATGTNRPWGIRRGIGPRFGRGFGWGRGLGWGRGFGATRYNAPVSPVEGSEKEALSAQAEMLQEELDAIRSRLNELESK